MARSNAAFGKESRTRLDRMRETNVPSQFPLLAAHTLLDNLISPSHHLAPSGVRTRYRASCRVCRSSAISRLCAVASRISPALAVAGLASLLARGARPISSGPKHFEVLGGFLSEH
jgi:hypothetical protein